MPNALPNNKVLKKKIETKEFLKSLNFLRAKRPLLSRYDSLEDLFFDADERRETEEANEANETQTTSTASRDEPTAAVLESLIVHLQKVCWQFRRTLFSYKIFISGSVLDQILYDKIRDKLAADPLTGALALIRKIGIHKPGIILYPVHSLSLLGVGLWERLNNDRYELFVADAELCARAQTNSLKETIAFVERAADAFGIRRSVPVEDMEHYERSRPTKWLTHNPLLAVKAHTFTNGFYENHRFIILRLESACSLLFCLSSVQAGFPTLRKEMLFSSGSINNWQTQDIHHFVLLEPKAGKPNQFSTRCIPMNARSIELAELCSLNISVNLKAWARRKTLMTRVCRAIGQLEDGCLKSNILSTKITVRHRVFNKIAQSLRYFRRSFRYTSGDDNVVMLTIALESLLTDSYVPNGGKCLKERAGLLLRGHSNKTACIAEIGRIYQARNQVVHTAERKQEVSLARVREAYVLCLVNLVERLGLLPHESSNPIQTLIEGGRPLPLSPPSI